MTEHLSHRRSESVEIGTRQLDEAFQDLGIGVSVSPGDPRPVGDAAKLQDQGVDRHRIRARRARSLDGPGR
jgi:hypothetical protein